ncbi:MAG: potassium channel family protein [Candidatus Izimaplasma sp.]|nr:potassium channel family protein [Candidatus Izimaplasma bacterium]
MAKKKSTKKRSTKKKSTVKQTKTQIVKKDMKTVFDGKPKKQFGKTFYLVFALVFYAGAFFYINSVVYDNQDILQSALFAFAALFVVFILLNFNVHIIIYNFFRLPLKYLLDQAKAEVNKEIEVDSNKKGVETRFSKYRAVLTLLLYSVILLLLVGSQVYNGLLEDVKVLVIITSALSTAFFFIIIVCSWQYLFNIIPSVLENTIDAKNGFILTMSAMVMVVYIIFIIFEISFFAETMIFILIIGFIALLGVNLNMIVGEFNIFKNLRNRNKQSKTVTRLVFMIFFSFHLYVILYASVVAYSIYVWNPTSYNFTNFEYEEVLVTDVTYFGSAITDLYDGQGDLIENVYDAKGNLITQFKKSDGTYKTEFYDEDGNPIVDFYQTPDALNAIAEVEKNGVYYYPVYQTWASNFFTYANGELVGLETKALPHTYGDMLYYAVITISSIGYGDISPNSNVAIAQFWGGFLSIYGITFYALSIGYVSNIAGLSLDSKE